MMIVLNEIFLSIGFHYDYYEKYCCLTLLDLIIISYLRLLKENQLKNHKIDYVMLFVKVFIHKISELDER